jgi:hypothetical protein
MDHFEKFLEALEEFVDARDDAWMEEENHNYKHAIEIIDTRAEPAKLRMREAFNMAVRDVINNYPAVQKIYFMEE